MILELLFCSFTSEIGSLFLGKYLGPYGKSPPLLLLEHRELGMDVLIFIAKDQESTTKLILSQMFIVRLSYHRGEHLDPVSITVGLSGALGPEGG